jgi:hypothetical protein
MARKMSVISPKYEVAQYYVGGEIPTPPPVQKAITIGSAGFLGLLTFSGLGVNFPVTRRGVKESAKFGRYLDKLTIATLFVNAGRAELSINGEKVTEAEAKYNQIETKAVLLKGGEGIPTKGENLEIELTCTHVIGSGLKYAACATIVGIK